MISEMLYTSSIRTLRSGQPGYGTVLATRGMPAALQDALEKACGYRHLDEPGSHRNPIHFAYRILESGNRKWHVFSRVADCGADYSGRSNFLAHHLALSEDEFSSTHLPSNPASLMGATGFFRTTFDGQERLLEPHETERRFQEASRTIASSGIPVLWNEKTKFPAWVGQWLDRSCRQKSEPLYLIYPVGTDTLGLIHEAMALLPPSQRWRTTFSTFYSKSVGNCLWRCLPSMAEEAFAIRDSSLSFVLDLDRLPSVIPSDIDDACLRAARTGIPLEDDARNENADSPNPRKTIARTKPGARIESPAAPNKTSEDEFDDEFLELIEYDLAQNPIGKTQSEPIRTSGLSRKPPPIALPHAANAHRKQMRKRLKTIGIPASAFLLTGLAVIGYFLIDQGGQPLESAPAASESAGTKPSKGTDGKKAGNSKTDPDQEDAPVADNAEKTLKKHGGEANAKAGSPELQEKQSPKATKEPDEGNGITKGEPAEENQKSSASDNPPEKKAAESSGNDNPDDPKTESGKKSDKPASVKPSKVETGSETDSQANSGIDASWTMIASEIPDDMAISLSIIVLSCLVSKCPDERMRPPERTVEGLYRNPANRFFEELRANPIQKLCIPINS